MTLSHISTDLCAAIELTLNWAAIVPVATAASMGTTFPSATTTTAVVFGTDGSTGREMLKAGLPTTVASTTAAGVLGYLVASAVFPWPV